MNPAETIINFLEFLAKTSHTVLGEDLQELLDELAQILKKLTDEQLNSVAEVINEWIRSNSHIKEAMFTIREPPHDSGLGEILKNTPHL